MFLLLLLPGCGFLSLSLTFHCPVECVREFCLYRLFNFFPIYLTLIDLCIMTHDFSAKRRVLKNKKKRKEKIYFLSF